MDLIDLASPIASRPESYALLGQEISGKSVPAHRQPLTAALGLIFAFVMALALSGCLALGGETSQEPGVPSSVVPTETPAPTPSATPVPTAVAGPEPTPNARGGTDQTPLPATPTPTPPPTPRVAEATPTPTPTPASQTAPTKPPAALPGVHNLGDGVTLEVSPESPVAGRQTTFVIRGLTPWTPVEVTFIDPQGSTSEWITAEDVHLRQGDGSTLTNMTLFAGAAGSVSWVRYGTQDVPGNWSVRLSFDGRIKAVPYELSELNLSGLEAMMLGTPLKGYHGDVSVTFFSEFVPAALALDLQEELERTALLLDRRLGVRSEQIPELYLLGNRSLLDLISQATEVDLGFEDGYYRSFGIRPGIYMRADLLETEVQALMVHEYVHLVFDGVGKGKQLPAWITEGLAQYYEFETGLAGRRPSATKLRAFRSADEARQAAQADALLPMSELESQADWNSRQDAAAISLQYSQASMAIRYLSETFGDTAPVDLVADFGQGADLSTALESATGLSQAEFETQFTRWLKNWDDPERFESVAYLDELDRLIATELVIFNRRSADLMNPGTRAQSAALREVLVEDAEAIVAEVRSIPVPSLLQDLNDEATAFFELAEEWLGLELEHARNGSDSHRVRANQLLPEVNARETLLKRNADNARFVLNLPD